MRPQRLAASLTNRSASSRLETSAVAKWNRSFSWGSFSQARTWSVDEREHVSTL